MRRRQVTERAIGLLGVALLSIGLFGCGTSTSVATATPEASVVATPKASASAVEATVAPPAAEAKPPITLSFWSGATAGVLQDGVQSDSIAQLITEKTGVSIDWIFNTDDEKFATLIASKNLPDIFVTGWGNTDPLITGNLVYDIKDLLETNGQEIKKNLSSASLQFSYDTLSGNTGKLYFLPYMAYSVEDQAVPEGVWGGVYTRWDYYKELGYPELNNFDDYLKLVSDMLKAHPVNEDGLENYGFSIWFDWGSYFQTNTMTVQSMGLVDLVIGCDPVEYDRMTLVPYNRYYKEDSAFWQGAEFWFKANRMGLLDPESFTQSYDQAEAKYNSNQVLASTISWLSPNKYYADKNIYDKGFFGPLPVKGSRGYFYGGWPSGDDAAIGISAGCAAPDRAMDLLNWMNSTDNAFTLINGIEGVDWVKDGDAYQFTEKGRKQAVDGDLGKYYNNLIIQYTWQKIPGTDQPFPITASVDFEKERLLLPENTLIREACEHYGVDVPSQILPEGVQYEHADSGAHRVFLPVEISDEDLKMLDYQIDVYLQQAIVQIINAKDEADFAAQKAKIIKDVKDMGIDRVYDFWANEIAKGRDKLKALQ